jgi:uncharacterized damage-inducible protein DinB
MRHAIVAAGLVIMAGLPAAAQSGAAGGNPVSASIQSQWTTVRGYVQRSAEAMPEANYGFKPVDTVRSYGQILAHLAGANYEFCAAAKGEQSPHGEGDFEKSATTRAQIVKVLNDSLAYCDTVYKALTDASGAQAVNMPFGMGKGARAGVLMMNTGHMNEHYGNLVTYLRIRGIVPPSSQPQR